MKKSIALPYLAASLALTSLAVAEPPADAPNPLVTEAVEETPSVPLVQGGDDADVVRALLACGANVHAKDANGRSLLHEAAACGNAESVRLLLEAGAEVRDVDNDGNTALHLAVQKGCMAVVKELLEAEANVNATNKAGDTPLIIATRKQDAGLVIHLLSVGADAALGNYSDETPLSIAYAINWADGLQILQEASPKR